MNQQRPRWLAITLSLASIGFALAAAALHVLNSAAPGPAGAPAPDDVAMAVLFPLVGLLIAYYRPDNRIGWVCNLIGLSGSLAVLSPEYAIYALFTRPAALPGGALMSWLHVWVWSPGWLGIALLMSLFPTGRLLSRRWVVPIAIELAAVLAWIIILGGATWPYRGPALFATDLPPEMQQAAALFDQLAPPLFLAIVLGLLASIVGALVRFRRSRGVERQQMKWFVVALICTALAAGTTFAFGNFVPLTGELATLAYLLEILAFSSGPLAIGIAIMRYRLYDIDIIAHRALVYATLTLTLALLYIGSIVLLQQLFQAISGQESDLAIIASTLAIAGLFNPLRRRIQAVIDRRFYRHKYDAAKTLATLSVRLRDVTDLDALTGDILAVVEEAMRPAHLSLWLAPASEHRGGE